MTEALLEATGRLVSSMDSAAREDEWAEEETVVGEGGGGWVLAKKAEEKRLLPLEKPLGLNRPAVPWLPVLGLESL